MVSSASASSPSTSALSGKPDCRQNHILEQVLDEKHANILALAAELGKTKGKKPELKL